MNDDVLEKIHQRYGDIGATVFFICVIVSFVCLFVLCMATVIIYQWPIIFPPIIAGYMLYKVNQGEPK